MSSATRFRYVTLPAIGGQYRIADGIECDLGTFLFDEQRLLRPFALDYAVQNPR